jgi:hypothetical protein
MPISSTFYWFLIGLHTRHDSLLQIAPSGLLAHSISTLARIIFAVSRWCCRFDGEQCWLRAISWCRDDIVMPYTLFLTWLRPAATSRALVSLAFDFWVSGRYSARRLYADAIFPRNIIIYIGFRLMINTRLSRYLIDFLDTCLIGLFHRSTLMTIYQYYYALHVVPLRVPSPYPRYARPASAYRRASSI